MKVTLAMPPKFFRKPGRKRNGAWMAISAPLSEAPVPLIVVTTVQIGCESCAGLRKAGDEAASTVAGRPVEVKVWPVSVALTGKLFTSFLNSATEKIDCGAKYH